MRFIKLNKALLRFWGGVILIAIGVYAGMSLLAGSYSGVPSEVLAREFSPNGEYLVIARVESPGDMPSYAVYVQHVKSGHTWRLEHFPFSMFREEYWWSPHSTHIVYVEDGHIEVVDANGRNRRQVATCTFSCRNPLWSSNGQYIYFIDLTSEYTALKRVDYDGQQVETVAICPSRCNKPTWMPDQRYIVMQTRSNDTLIAPTDTLIFFDAEQDQFVDYLGQRATDVSPVLQHLSPTLLRHALTTQVFEELKAIPPTETEVGRYTTDSRYKIDQLQKRFHIIDTETGERVREITYQSIYRTELPMGIDLNYTLTHIAVILGPLMDAVVLKVHFRQPANHRAAEFVLILFMIVSMCGLVSAYYWPQLNH